MRTGFSTNSARTICTETGSPKCITGSRPGGLEVDFIINHIDCAVECKSSARIGAAHLKGLRRLLIDHHETKRRIIVCLEAKDRKTEDGIENLHYQTFITKLWDGDFF